MEDDCDDIAVEQLARAHFATQLDPVATMALRPNVEVLCSVEPPRRATAIEHTQHALLCVIESSGDFVRGQVQERLLPLLGKADVDTLRMLFLHALCTEPKLRHIEGSNQSFYAGLQQLHKLHLDGEITQTDFVLAAGLLHSRVGDEE